MKKVQKYLICNFLEYNEISALQCTNTVINDEIMNYSFIWKQCAENTLNKKIYKKRKNFEYLRDKLCLIKLKNIQKEIKLLNLNYLFQKNVPNDYDLRFSYVFRYMHYSDVYRNKFKCLYKNLISWCSNFDVTIQLKRKKQLNDIFMSFKSFLQNLNNPQNRIINGIKEILISNQ